MKNDYSYKSRIAFILLIVLLTSLNTNAQIAINYPFDDSIQNDPDVIFVEMFEGPVSSLTGPGNSWNTVSPNPANVISDVSVPNGSLGAQSLHLITIQDGTNQNQNTLLYKKITPDITDSIFVRYYIKFDTNTVYHHSGLWLGGKNPPSSIPGNLGGALPQGDQEFHVGTEIKGVANGMPAANSLFGLYTYWMGMHQSSGGPYYGNEFYNSTTADNIDLASWNCIEVMVKLNYPVSVSNGEIKLWINGTPIHYLGYQFPTGSWSFNHFTEGTGVPFEGFQFRNDSALNLNYIWLRNFNDMNPNGHPGNIYFDHLVVAKKYIGPLSTSTTGIKSVANDNEFLMYPNPATELISFSGPLKGVELIDFTGTKVTSYSNEISEINISELKPGMYFIKHGNSIKKFIKESKK